MKSRQKLWARVFALCAAFAAPAGATQPLEAFLERAEAHAFDAREAGAVTRQREAETDVALGRLLPSFSARGVYTRNQREVAATLPGAGERLVITPLNQLDAFLQLDVPIVDLASHHRYKSAQALSRSAGAQQEVARIDVARSVSRAYYQYLGASALRDSALQSVEVARANQSYVEDRRAAGAATDLDHERALANVARAEQDVADAELAVQLSGRGLATLSGLVPEPAEPNPLEDDLHLEPPLERWNELSRSAPQLRVARELRAAAEQSRKATSRSVLPTLSASAQERLTNATGFAGQSANYSLQLVLSFRLDYAVRSAEAAQAAALEAQSVRLERTERALLDLVFEAYQRVQAGIAKGRAARAQVRAASRAAELSQDRYAIGASTQLDVTQAQRDAFLAQAAKIQADADLAYARAALRLSAGVPLTTKDPVSSER